MDIPIENRCIDFTYIDQTTYLGGYHRSGWNFVTKNLIANLQCNDENKDKAIWCDLYMDRTFHSLHPILPYTRYWIGFVHHTFDTTFSDWNNVQLLNNPMFIQSIPFCRGIFVFSVNQREKFLSEFSKRNWNIPVVSLVHPTEFVDASGMWTFEKLYNNFDRSLVQVGAWLRDNYQIYKVFNGDYVSNSNQLSLRKKILNGKNMDIYRKPLNFFEFFKEEMWKEKDLVPTNQDICADVELDLVKKLPSGRITSINGEIPLLASEQQNYPTNVNAICRDIISRDDGNYRLNKYVRGAIDLLKYYDNSVTQIPELSNNDYDTLLSSNVVLLPLIDVAACNTLNECIVRNTPVIMPRLPAIVELIGPTYDLFYDTPDQIDSLLTRGRIEAASNFFARIDKTPLTIEYFLKTFVSSSIYQRILGLF